jgi:uncharacterized protein DUF1579
MKKLLQCGAVLGAFVVAGAGAQEKKTMTPPSGAGASGSAAKTADAGKPMGAPAGAEEAMPPKPGAETMALKPLATTLSLSGNVPAGAMGPNSPAMTTKGTHTCKWSADKLWLNCEIKDTMGTGKQAMTWVGHMTVGWDFSAKMYRAVLTDNMGMAMMMQGKMDGAKLPLESVGDYQMMGHPMKMRFTMDMTDPKALKYADERDIGKSGKFTTFEEGTMKAGGGK